MANLREEMEAQALLNSARPTSSLSCVTLRHICLHETAELAFLIEPERCMRKCADARQRTYLISLCFPESITQVMSGMVIPVSAMFVAE
jgi:hypothetical protein